jgi:hypothetical protein
VISARSLRTASLRTSLALLAATALLALALTLAAGPAAAAPGQESSGVRLATQAADREDELQVRPAVISYTGDGTGYVGGRTTSPDHYERGGIDWLSWGPRSAFGRGYVWINDCRPYCAAGHFHKHRGTVRASRPRHGLFTRLTITYRWRGRRAHDHRVLEHTPPYSAGGQRYPGFYYWGV